MRWGAGGRVYLATTDNGVLEARVAETVEVRRVLIREGTHDPLAFWLASELAASAHWLVGGGWLESGHQGVGWRRPSGGGDELEGSEEFDTLFDHDVAGDRLLVLGAKRDERERLAPDGALGWLGELGPQGASLRPVFYSADGPGVRHLVLCVVMDLGIARFLADGSFLLIPHVEEDVHLFDSEGRLRRTWSAEALGFDAGCPLSVAEADHLAVDEPARWEWINGRRTVDDVLPLPQGAGVLIRTVRDGATSWELKLLHPEGGVKTCPVPLTYPTPRVHLRGDVRDGRIVLLVLRRDAFMKRKLDLEPQLVTADLER